MGRAGSSTEELLNNGRPTLLTCTGLSRQSTPGALVLPTCDLYGRFYALVSLSLRWALLGFGYISTSLLLARAITFYAVITLTPSFQGARDTQTPFLTGRPGSSSLFLTTSTQPSSPGEWDSETKVLPGTKNINKRHPGSYWTAEL